MYICAMKYFLFAISLIFLVNRSMTWSLGTSSRWSTAALRRGDAKMLRSTKNGDMLYLSNRMDIKIGLPTRDHDLAAKFLRTRKNCWMQLGNMACISWWTKRKKYTLMFPPIGIPGIDTLSTRVEVTFQQADGKVSLRSNDWSIRGKTSYITRFKFYGDVSDRDYGRIINQGASRH